MNRIRRILAVVDRVRTYATAAPWILLALLGPALTRAGAQVVDSVEIRVSVADSLGSPIQGADVSLIGDGGRSIASGLTDAAGTHVFLLPALSGDYDLVVRKLGYRRSDQFLRLGGARTIAVRLVVRRAVQTLSAMTVTGEADLKRKSYYIDADAIANSDRTLIDATDIVSKLRPDMLRGRSGRCTLSNIWINGKRIVDPPVNDMVVARTSSDSRVTVTVSNQEVVTRGMLRGGSIGALSVLASINPDHIAEMRYIDCLSPGIGTARGTTSAVYVNLKPGVVYEEGRKTKVAALPPVAP